MTKLEHRVIAAQSQALILLLTAAAPSLSVPHGLAIWDQIHDLREATDALLNEDQKHGDVIE